MKEHLAAEAAARMPATSAQVISFYRHHARRWETSARNALNGKMRAEMSICRAACNEGVPELLFKIKKRLALVDRSKRSPQTTFVEGR